ncbi:MAG: PAS domain-containing protein [Terracidiphilus sp.]|jgi:PAS domain S-box-containing protein
MNEISGALPAAAGDCPSDALDELPVSYVEMDAHGAITRANRLSRLHHSADAGELIGKLAWELMPTEEQELSCAAFMMALEMRQNPPVARRSIYTSSGDFLVYELHRNLILDRQGQPVGMRVVSVDVSDAHRAYEEAERGRLWLESVLGALTDAVIVTDSLGLIRTVNPAAEELFGWKAAELIGKEVEKALPVLSCVSDDKAHPGFTIGLDERAQGVATMLDRECREVRVMIGSSPIVDRELGCTAGVVSVLRQVE